MNAGIVYIMLIITMNGVIIASSICALCMVNAMIVEKAHTSVVALSMIVPCTLNITLLSAQMMLDYLRDE